MEENQRKMTPNEYVQEFIFTLNQLRDTPEKLFKEWPIDVILFGESGIEKPIYTQFAEYFLNNYKISPKDYLDRIKPINRTVMPNRNLD